jgi:hypothetical protein
MDLCPHCYGNDHRFTRNNGSPLPVRHEIKAAKRGCCNCRVYARDWLVMHRNQWCKSTTEPEISIRITNRSNRSLGRSTCSMHFTLRFPYTLHPYLTQPHNAVQTHTQHFICRFTGPSTLETVAQSISFKDRT